MYVTDTTPMSDLRKIAKAREVDITGMNRDDAIAALSKTVTKTGWVRMSHTTCDHPSTKAARDRCRAAHGHKSGEKKKTTDDKK